MMETAGSGSTAFRRIWVDTNSELEVWSSEAASGRTLRVRPDPSFHFDISDDGSVCQHLAPDADLEKVDSFVEDHLVPRLLSHRGQLVLHGGSVNIDGEVLIFLGPSGAGKSTLVCSFEMESGNLLGDDASVIEIEAPRVSAQAIRRSLRLRPDAVDALLSARPLKICPRSSKQIVILEGGDTPILPLRAIFLLGRDKQESPVTANRLRDVKACMGLVEHCFALDPTDRARAMARLEKCRDVALSVPVYSLSYPRRFSALPEVRSLVRKLVRQSSAQSSMIGTA